MGRETMVVVQVNSLESVDGEAIAHFGHHLVDTVPVGLRNLAVVGGLDEVPDQVLLGRVSPGVRGHDEGYCSEWLMSD